MINWKLLFVVFSVWSACTPYHNQRLREYKIREGYYVIQGQNNIDVKEIKDREGHLWHVQKTILDCPKLDRATDNLFIEGSFESHLVPRPGEVPCGWLSCSFPYETPPDIHGPDSRWFGVNSLAAKGRQFLGLSVRETGTYECIGQKLTDTLRKEQHYHCEGWLSKSPSFRSAVLGTSRDTVKNFTTPCVLRLWAGVSDCDRRYLLRTTPAIDHVAWQKYRIPFKVPEDCTHFFLEAYYENGGQVPYNGHILLDDIQLTRAHKRE